MYREKVETILEKVQKGLITVQEGIEQLAFLPFEEMGYAKVDHHRSLLRGFSEVVFCQGKTEEEVVSILQSILTRSDRALATRANPEIFEAVKGAIPDAVYNQRARTITVVRKVLPSYGKVLVVCAGTADLPVAEEAAETATIMGSRVERLFDVGISGLHRIFAHLSLLRSANVIVAVAGMEGALPSVVGSLVEKPVIAVPTSVGYGAHFGGLTPLLSMLNSCVPGVAVVNIDNGFGAGYLAHMINTLAEGKAK